MLHHQQKNYRPPVHCFMHMSLLNSLTFEIMNTWTLQSMLFCLLVLLWVYTDHRLYIKEGRIHASRPTFASVSNMKFIVGNKRHPSSIICNSTFNRLIINICVCVLQSKLSVWILNKISCYCSKMCICDLGRISRTLSQETTLTSSEQTEQSPKLHSVSEIKYSRSAKSESSTNYSVQNLLISFGGQRLYWLIFAPESPKSQYKSR